MNNRGTVNSDVKHYMRIWSVIYRLISGGTELLTFSSFKKKGAFCFKYQNPLGKADQKVDSVITGLSL